MVNNNVGVCDSAVVRNVLYFVVGHEVKCLHTVGKVVDFE